MNKEFIKVLATILGTVRIDKKGKVVQKPFEYMFEIKANTKRSGWAYLVNDKEHGDSRYYDKEAYLKAVKTYQEATEVIRLVPLSEFVKVDFENNPYKAYDKLIDIINYTDFITQQLTKGQFVPCGEDREVLEEHLMFTANMEGSRQAEEHRLKFQQAKDRVLFELCEGWSIDEIETKGIFRGDTLEYLIHELNSVGDNLYLKQ